MSDVKYYWIVEDYSRGMDERMGWNETIRVQCYASGNFFSDTDKMTFDRWYDISKGSDPSKCRAKLIKTIG